MDKHDYPYWLAVPLWLIVGILLSMGNDKPADPAKQAEAEAMLETAKTWLMANWQAVTCGVVFVVSMIVLLVVARMMFHR